MTQGRFYFKKCSNGNLLGEFSNNEMNRNSMECCNLTSENILGSFIGTYKSFWTEKDELKSYTLRIGFKPNSNNQLYSLNWTPSDENNSNIFYRGEGFLVDNILIGNYQNP